MINVIRRMPEFVSWLESLKDIQGKKAVMWRLERAKQGNLGDCEPVGNGISEMRVFTGPGYRVYFVRTGPAACTILWGSDKSDQPKAIKRAKSILDSMRGK